MRELVILAIRAYQRFVSPYKGFCCAYRVHTGRCSCSEFGRRAVKRKGVFTGLMLIDARLQRCGDVHRSRRLHAQRGVVHCDLPDLSASDACDCADACSSFPIGGSDCDDCSSFRWRRRRDGPDQYVQIRPSSRKPQKRPDDDSSNSR